jgi:hypothetical protein
VLPPSLIGDFPSFLSAQAPGIYFLFRNRRWRRFSCVQVMLLTFCAPPEKAGPRGSTAPGAWMGSRTAGQHYSPCSVSTPLLGFPRGPRDRAEQGNMSGNGWPDLVNGLSTRDALRTPYEMLAVGRRCGLSKVATPMGRCGFQPVPWRGQELNPERRKLDAPGRDASPSQSRQGQFYFSSHFWHTR